MLFTASFLVPLFLLGFPPFLFARKAEEGRDNRFRRAARISYWSNIPSHRAWLCCRIGFRLGLKDGKQVSMAFILNWVLLMASGVSKSGGAHGHA